MLTLCVLLWANPGQEAALVAYEDRVLRLLPDHGGRVLQRARANGDVDGEEPLEIHILQFPSEDALENYMKDERRTALAAERDGAIARTVIHRVTLVVS